MNDKELIPYKSSSWVHYDNYCQSTNLIRGLRDFSCINGGFRIMLRKKNQWLKKN